MTTTFNAAATKTVRVNGTNFVYREIGNKSGIPVVFLHHLTAVLEDWDPAIADGLAKVGYFRYFLSLFFTNPQNKFFQIVQILALVSIQRLC